MKGFLSKPLLADDDEFKLTFGEVVHYDAHLPDRCPHCDEELKDWDDFAFYDLCAERGTYNPDDGFVPEGSSDYENSVFAYAHCAHCSEELPLFKCK